MINKEFSKILIENINVEDSLYLFSSNGNSSILEFSGYRCYIPILLERVKENYYRVVWGIEQAQFLRGTKVNYIDSFILSGGSQLDFFVYAILYSQLYGKLNVIEKSIIIDKLINIFSITSKEVVSIYLSLIKENPSSKLLRLFLGLKDLLDSIKTYIVKEGISLSLAYEFSYFSIDEQRYIYIIIKELNLSISNVRLMLNNIKYLSKRDNKSSYDILDSLFKVTLNSKSVNIRQKAFLDELSIMRYPLYTEQMNNVKKHIKDLSLPPRFNIKLSKYLEGEGIDIYLKIKNIDDYIIMINKLNKLIENDKIRELFSII